jgi:flagellar FliJ protein
MGAFKFRLQQVLDIRQQTERQAAARLADAEAVADEARLAQHALEAVQERGSQALHQAHANEATVGQLKTIGYVIEQLSHQIIDAQTRVDSAEEKVSESRTGLTAALQARRVLSRLRDRHFATWRTADNAQQMKQMDELALSRFVRREDNDNDNSGAVGK